MISLTYLLLPNFRTSDRTTESNSHNAYKKNFNAYNHQTHNIPKDDDTDAENNIRISYYGQTAWECDRNKGRQQQYHHS